MLTSYTTNLYPEDDSQLRMPTAQCRFGVLLTKLASSVPIENFPSMTVKNCCMQKQERVKHDHRDLGIRQATSFECSRSRGSANKAAP
ncbi:hypothetical protein Mapa_016023 [Marchantia paleacea]|nr:hypothetical protein Mapa_016023 [Marchantia paleacea]